MKSQALPTNRYSASTAGWSAVDVVAPFSNAIGRVSGGRGSAVLVAVMDSEGQLIDTTTPNFNLSTVLRGAGVSGGGSSSGEDVIGRRSQLRVTRDSLRSSRVSAEGVGARKTKPQPPLGVLLTTSHVWATAEAADASTVTFLDQLSITTIASLRNEARPVAVGPHSAYGFVSSASERRVRQAVLDGVKANGRRQSERGAEDAEMPDYVFYRSMASSDDDDEEEEEEIGFTLTYCGLVQAPPVEPQAMAGPGPRLPLYSGDCYKQGGESSRTNILIPLAGEGQAQGGTAYSSSSSPTQRLGPRQTSPTSRQPSQRSSSVHTTDYIRPGAPPFAGPTYRDSILAVKPLPLPLLPSTIPEIRVGDAHLMITHVNDGRRCYRVQTVSAVHPDFCEYTPDVLSSDVCSGGAVFNAAGDFIGIQHERRGHSLCLLTRSIVRHLFDSDLLGMCRSPISEVGSGKKPEHHTRPGEHGQGTPHLLRRSCPSSADSSNSARWSPRGSHTKGRELALQSADAMNTGTSPTASALPRSQQVPGYEEVFAEYYTDLGSLTHMLYAFPHSQLLLKLALETLAQLRFGVELDQMSVLGGVGAILETLDGYPHDEAIVSGALSAMCRICVHERNLAMFLHLDGITTTMEVLKEYVHQPTVLQWGVYLLQLATDGAVATATESATVVARCGGAQLLVNVLRVHGSLQRKSTLRQLQHNRLVRWTCDVIANMLSCDPRRPRLFLREDLLPLLLQLLRDYAGNVFLTEGLVHLFSVFVRCFADLGGGGSVPLRKEQDGVSACTIGAMTVQTSSLRTTDTQSPSPYAVVNDKRPMRASSGGELVPQLAQTLLLPPISSLTASYATSSDPHLVSFFFLCQSMEGDHDACFLAALLDMCEAALDTKNSVAAHRGRPEKVLTHYLVTIRLLLRWGLLCSREGAGMGYSPRGTAARASMDSFPSSLHSSTPATLLTPPSLFASDLTALVMRLRGVLQQVRLKLPTSTALLAEASTIEGLTKGLGAPLLTW